MDKKPILRENFNDDVHDRRGHRHDHHYAHDHRRGHHRHHARDRHDDALHDPLHGNANPIHHESASYRDHRKNDFHYDDIRSLMNYGDSDFVSSQGIHIPKRCNLHRSDNAMHWVQNKGNFRRDLNRNDSFRYPDQWGHGMNFDHSQTSTEMV